MKDPTTALPDHPAVLTAINADPINGPRHDRYRRFIGVEYETLLQRILEKNNIPFQTEDDLRRAGERQDCRELFRCGK